MVDLSPLLDGVLVAAVPTIVGFAVPALVSFSKKHGVELTAQQQQLLTGLVRQALQAGAVKAEGLADAKGWDHPDVRNTVVSEGLEWLVNFAGPALQKCGVDVANGAPLMTLRAHLEAAAPAAIATVATSPATTNGPAKPVALVLTNAAPPA